MPGLKPFRTIPKNIVEWTKWMREQETGGSVASSTTSVTTADGTTTTITTATRWTIEEFDSDYVANVSDAGKLKLSSSASGVDFTINPGIFEVGDQIVIFQYGAGQVTIVAGSGTTIRTPSTLTINEQYGSVTLIMVLPEEWMIAGRMTP